MGKNARRRKEQQLMEKYGIPESARSFTWGTFLAGTLVTIILCLAIRSIAQAVKPVVTDWYSYATTSNNKTAPTPTPENQPSPQPSATTNQEKPNMIATMSTTMGDVKIELFSKDAPRTVENFTKLAEKGYYNGVIFHRVIKDFMIQGGDPTGTGTGGDSAFGGTFEDEKNDHKMEPGVLAMANRGPNTNGSQFFIVTESRQAHLEGKHTIFGKVTEGMDIVKKIAATEVDGNDRPTTDVKINGITLAEKK